MLDWHRQVSVEMMMLFKVNDRGQQVTKVNFAIKVHALSLGPPASAEPQ
jgi:hypothetical protein